MKVDDANSSALKGLVNRQRHLVAAKEREIENVREYYDAKKEADRFSGQKEVLEIKDANQKEILEAVENKASRLESMRASLQGDLGRLEKEKAILAEQTALEKESALAIMSDENDRIAQDAIDRSRDIGQKANHEISELQKESQWQVAKASSDARLKLDKQVQSHEVTLADKMREQKVQLTTRDIEHQQKLNKLRSEFEKDSFQVTRSNVVEKNVKQQQHAKDLKNQEDQYNYLLNEKRKQFEQKFAHLEKEHNEVMQRTEAKFREQLSALSEQYSAKREAATSRVDDPFYNLQKIGHRLEDTPTAYLIHVEVPEHEKDNIILSGHDRTLKMTLSRRFSDRVDNEDGSVNVNKRSENFSQEFPVADIINSKQITRKYEDGVLTFKVAKA